MSGKALRSPGLPLLVPPAPVSPAPAFIKQSTGKALRSQYIIIQPKPVNKGLTLLLMGVG